jgi:uncharacterized membrane protein
LADRFLALDGWRLDDFDPVVGQHLRDRPPQITPKRFGQVVLFLVGGTRPEVVDLGYQVAIDGIINAVNVDRRTLHRAALGWTLIVPIVTSSFPRSLATATWFAGHFVVSAASVEAHPMLSDIGHGAQAHRDAETTAIERGTRRLLFAPGEKPWKTPWGACVVEPVEETSIYETGLPRMVRGLCRRLCVAASSTYSTSS